MLHIGNSIKGVDQRDKFVWISGLPATSKNRKRHNIAAQIAAAGSTKAVPDITAGGCESLSIRYLEFLTNSSASRLRFEAAADSKK